MKTTKLLVLFLFTSLLTMAACSSNSSEPTTKPNEPLPSGTEKYIGGDISLLTKYEENGSIYVDREGNNIPQKYGNVLNFLKQQGMNTMRMRLFVEPANASATDKGQGVCQDLPYVKELGRRIKEAGMRFMLDFHYSDSWADPSKQWTPQAWQGLTDEALYEKIYDYTKDCLTQLVEAGAAPDFIQTGNEISFGMLWGAEGSSNNRCYMGQSDNWPRFTTLLRQAGKACREVCPDAKIILHTERVADPAVLVNFYTIMDQQHVDYDIIGLSYYPYFHGPLEQLDASLTELETTFKTKDIMMVEVGYYYAWQPADVAFDYSNTCPISPEGQKLFTRYLINTLMNHPKVNGLFWWWLEANEYTVPTKEQVTKGWYNASLFNDSNTDIVDYGAGKAMPALYELQNFK